MESIPVVHYDDAEVTDPELSEPDADEIEKALANLAMAEMFADMDIDFGFPDDPDVCFTCMKPDEWCDCKK